MYVNLLHKKRAHSFNAIFDLYYYFSTSVRFWQKLTGSFIGPWGCIWDQPVPSNVHEFSYSVKQQSGGSWTGLNLHQTSTHGTTKHSCTYHCTNMLALSFLSKGFGLMNIKVIILFKTLCIKVSSQGSLWANMNKIFLKTGQNVFVCQQRNHHWQCYQIYTEDE